MSTEILSPVEQPSLLYPALHGVRPRRKDYRCAKCGSTNSTRLITKTDRYSASILQNIYFDFTCDYCGNHFWTASKLIVNDIFEDQLNRIYDFTHETKKEFGAMVLKREDGDIILDMIVIGKDREVEMAPTHEIRSGEKILGTVHCHPITDFPSLWDVATFLRDDWEKISIVAGVDGNFNVMLKTDKSIKVSDVGAFVQENEKASTEELANTYNFLYYRGKVNNLKLTSDDNIQSSSLEDLFKHIEGVKEVKEKIKKVKRRIK